jgi:hypothetical protein
MQPPPYSPPGRQDSDEQLFDIPGILTGQIHSGFHQVRLEDRCGKSEPECAESCAQIRS